MKPFVGRVLAHNRVYYLGEDLRFFTEDPEEQPMADVINELMEVDPPSMVAPPPPTGHLLRAAEIFDCQWECTLPPAKLPDGAIP